MSAKMVQAGGDATIYRDTWGVPHIYGLDEERTLFGQGYAQAQDRLGTIYKAYRKANGRMSEAFGQEWVEYDYRQRLLGHMDVSRKRYHEISRQGRRGVESFISGIKAFGEENPKLVPDWSCEIEPSGMVTLGWFIISGWQLSEAAGKLARRSGEDRGSNEWAVGRSRSRDGVAMACIDPHVHWEDEWLFHEAHLHGGDLHVFGFSPVGTPYISLGHNRYLSWAMTTGGPDTSDVYEEELNPDGSKYLYDGKLMDLQRETIAIKVRTAEGIKEVERQIARTHHGPVAKTSGGKAYAFKLSLLDQVHLLDQIRLMNTAQNLGEFLKALSMLQLMPQNLMYADIHGNTYYQRSGRVPIRPKGYDWKRPVPGNTSKTEWLGMHPMEDLVQVLNPPSGFMQNCNISPGMMTFNSPLTASRYGSELYNTSTKHTNPRGSRFLEIMRKKGRIGVQDGLEIMVETTLRGTENLRRKLWLAYARRTTKYPTLEKAVRIIHDWTASTDVDSIGMTLYAFWLRELEARTDRISTSRIRRSKTLKESDRQTLLTALQKTCEYMLAKFGSVEVAWGRVHRGRRGNRSWPLAGCGDTLRAIGTDGPDEEGIFYANRGQSCPTLVVFRSSIESYSAVPYGESEDPSSPHYTDQGEKLFAQRRLKPTWFSEAGLLQNLESSRSLVMPDPAVPV